MKNCKKVIQIAALAIFNLSLVISSSSCVHISAPLPSKQQADVFSSFQSAQTQLKFLEGTAEIHGGGFAKLLGSTTADFLVGYPHQFLFSFRTFFETPGLIVSSDASHYYYLRMLEDGGVLYDRGLVGSARIKAMIPSELMELDFNGMILGHLDLGSYRIDDIRKPRRSEMLDLIYSSKDRQNDLKIRWNPLTKSIQSYEKRHRDALIEKVIYDSFIQVDNHWIAQKIDAQIMVSGKLQRIKITLQDPILNQSRDVSDYQISRP